MFKLDLGVLTSWDEVVKEFYRAPARWWYKCMSSAGQVNQLTLLKQNIWAQSTDAETGAAISDGAMFKKNLLTPEQVISSKVGRTASFASILIHLALPDSRGISPK